MNQFSILLGKYIKDRGYSNFGFAKICGIERTLMQKYISGSRYPSSKEILFNILDKLRLSPDEEREMLELYEKSVLGDKHESYHMFENLIEDLGDLILPDTSIEMNKLPVELYSQEVLPVAPEKCYQILEGQRTIYKYITLLLNRNIYQSETTIRIICSTENGEVNRLLTSISPIMQAEVRQLVCMDSKLESAASNIELLKKILPLFASSMNYDVKYYYGNQKEHINSLSVLPNFILTESELICFDYKMNHGLYYTDPEIIAMYQEIYSEIERKSRKLLEVENSISDICRFYAENKPADYGLNYNPTVTYSFSKKLFKEIISNDASELLGMLNIGLEIISNWGAERQKRGLPLVTYYFSKDGFDFFMKTGRVMEYPHHVYKPIPPEWREKVMLEHIEQIENDSIEAYLLQDYSVRTGPGMWVNCHGDKLISFVSADSSGNLTRMELRETGIIKVVVEYLEYLKSSVKTYSKEETIQWMRQRVQYWKKKYAET